MENKKSYVTYLVMRGNAVWTAFRSERKARAEVERLEAQGIEAYVYGWNLQ